VLDDGDDDTRDQQHEEDHGNNHTHAWTRRRAARLRTRRCSSHEAHGRRRLPCGRWRGVWCRGSAGRFGDW
jgi:hypothetical protein